MNNVKLLHIKLFFSNFSVVQYHWKIRKKIWPLPKKSWNDATVQYPALIPGIFWGTPTESVNPQKKIKMQ